MRGEYPATYSPPKTTLELPPRARRILRSPERRAVRRGTTSACAENTTAAVYSRCCRGNYLRVRGEYAQVLQPDILAMELPPRARRILPQGGLGMVDSGTTSACAENTLVRRVTRVALRNYLRVRGEYAQVLQPDILAMELPPRARRIQIVCKPLVTDNGTTSACAENTHAKN